MSTDRLSPLDASFLHLEDATSHMHVAAALIFAGDAPAYERLLAHIESRLGLVPNWTLESALPLLQRSARGHVEGLVGGPDPFESVKDAVRQRDVDEVIISTLPRRTSKWLRRDLIRRVERLGLPVTAIVPGGAKLSREDQLEIGTGAGLGLGGGA